MPVYELHWKAIPLGVIEHFRDWYDPYLGCGVYMMVVATTDGRYVTYYIGKSKDTGRRWREHLRSWFLEPDTGYSIVRNPVCFLTDPVAVINQEDFEQGLDGRVHIQRQILDQSWFTYAELDCRDLAPGLLLEHIEYVLQEKLKEHISITTNGWIGDAGIRQPPPIALTIRNRFGRDFLSQTLPSEMVFQPD